MNQTIRIRVSICDQIVTARNTNDLEATRETWEEAGVTGKIVKSLGVIDDLRPPKEWNTNKEEFMNSEVLKHPPRSEFHFFEMIVEKEYDTFPESHKRQRRWVTYQEAIDELKSIKRLELVEAIERSSVTRSQFYMYIMNLKQGRRHIVFV